MRSGDKTEEVLPNYPTKGGIDRSDGHGPQAERSSHTEHQHLDRSGVADHATSRRKPVETMEYDDFGGGAQEPSLMYLHKRLLEGQKYKGQCHVVCMCCRSVRGKVQGRSQFSETCVRRISADDKRCLLSEYRFRKERGRVVR